MKDKLRTNWSVEATLANLQGYRRIDDAWDHLAFRLAGELSGRTVYIYLYGDDPDAIHFDLEDEFANDVRDHAVSRGTTHSLHELKTIVEGWLTRSQGIPLTP